MPAISTMAQCRLGGAGLRARHGHAGSRHPPPAIRGCHRRHAPRALAAPSELHGRRLELRQNGAAAGACPPIGGWNPGPRTSAGPPRLAAPAEHRWLEARRRVCGAAPGMPGWRHRWTGRRGAAGACAGAAKAMAAPHWPRTVRRRPVGCRIGGRTWCALACATQPNARQASPTRRAAITARPANPATRSRCARRPCSDS